MRTSKYQVFMRVVEEQSLTRAAEALNYTQSGISHIIKNLEKELGCRLLIRSNVNFRLTPEGERLLEVIKSIANSEERLYQMADDIAGIRTGRIRIGTMCSVSTLWLPHIIRKYTEKHPQVQFDLRDADYESSERLLAEDLLDCAFLPKPRSGALSHELLHMDRYYAVFPHGHPWCSLDRIPIGLFADETFIMPTEGMDYRLGDLFRQSDIKPRSFINVKDDFATMSMVYAGLGVTILSKMFLDCFTPDIEIRELAPETYRDLGFCLHKGREMAPATAAFREFVFDWVRNATLG
ncbi:MAG: LysR family transcriptional regulator [Mogibacterium sp.]|nr:LysR family transcriptional regulator [Mogibacterium sp.]